MHRLAWLPLLLAVLLQGVCAADPPAPCAPQAALARDTPFSEVVPFSPEASPAPTPFEQHRERFTWPPVWGVVGVPFFLGGEKMAPNGHPYDPLFTIDLDFNVGLYNTNTVYLFADTRFWTQRAGDGVTNPQQKGFDFSKRQLDFDIGGAWRYYGPLEARVYGYSGLNFNRGFSPTQPMGFKDGVALEQRLYLGNTFFDLPRRSYLTVGYCPTNEMVGGDGFGFRPSLFAGVKLAYDLIDEVLFVSGECTLIAQRPQKARLLWVDAGVSWRPFEQLPGMELRAGTENTGDLQEGSWRDLWYLAVRLVF